MLDLERRDGREQEDKLIVLLDIFEKSALFIISFSPPQRIRRRRRREKERNATRQQLSSDSRRSETLRTHHSTSLHSARLAKKRERRRKKEKKSKGILCFARAFPQPFVTVSSFSTSSSEFSFLEEAPW